MSEAGVPCGFSNCSTNTLAEKPPWGPLSTPLGVMLENSGPSLVCMKCSEHLDLFPFFFFIWIRPWMSQKVPALRMREERACALREAESPLPCHFPGPPQAGVASRSYHCLSPCLTEATSCHKHLQQSIMNSELTCWVSISDYSPRVLSLQGYFCLPSRPPQGLLGVLAHLCEPCSNLDTSSLSQTNPHIFLAFYIVTVKDTK